MLQGCSHLSHDCQPPFSLALLSLPSSPKPSILPCSGGAGGQLLCTPRSHLVFLQLHSEQGLKFVPWLCFNPNKRDSYHFTGRQDRETLGTPHLQAFLLSHCLVQCKAAAPSPAPQAAFQVTHCERPSVQLRAAESRLGQPESSAHPECSFKAMQRNVLARPE